MTTKDGTKCKNIHIQSGLSVDMVIKSSLVRRTLDNVTLVMITFSNFERLFTSEYTNDHIKETKQKTDEDDYKNNIYLENVAAVNNHLKNNLGDLNLNSNSNLNSLTGSPGLVSYNNHIGSFNKAGVNTMNMNHQSHNTKTNTSGISNLSLNSLHSPNNSHQNNEYSSNFESFPRKNPMQKKLVSLDLTSSKASGGNFTAKDLEKKKLDYSEQFEKKFNHFSNNRTPLFLQSNIGDYQPSTTKNSINKRDHSLKKNPK